MEEGQPVNSSEPYSETVGSTPESLTELQKRHVEAVRRQLDVTLCESCQHPNRMHGPSGHCYFPCPPHGEQCETCNPGESE